jgi:hypothetical protein
MGECAEKGDSMLWQFREFAGEPWKQRGGVYDCQEGIFFK